MSESQSKSSKISANIKNLSQAIEAFEAKTIEYAKLRDKNFLSSEE
jgi:hypothetical protein